ncbi:MAG: hypothetical protein V1721_06180 [Pseudomonadota bacterium]
MKHFTFILALALIFAVSSQASAASRDEQKAEIQKIKSTVLSKLYKEHPEAEKKIAKAVGYAVFSSADVAYIFFSGGYGAGCASAGRRCRSVSWRQCHVRLSRACWRTRGWTLFVLA